MTTSQPRDTEAQDSHSHVPRMGAEAGFDVSEVHVPLRISGYVCLVLGLVSVFCFLAVPLLLIPVVAIIVGMIALRPSRHGRPVGTTAALIGVLCAVGFGACGVSVAWFKQKTFGGQAEYFARQYFDVLARGEFELALELKKDFVNRFSADMPLKTYYATHPGSDTSLADLRDDTITQELQELGTAAALKMTKTPRVYQKYGHDRVDLYFKDAANPKARTIWVVMECSTDPRNGIAHWHVHQIQYEMKALYAQKVL